MLTITEIQIIRTASSGLKFDVQFYNCDMDSGCEDLNFIAVFENKRQTSWEVINKWNQNRLLGRAFLADDGGAALDHPIVEFGDLSDDTWSIVMARWDREMSRFAREIGFLQ